MIIIDSREPKRIDSYLKNNGINTKREFLEIGDYLLEDGVVIERKDNDIIQSITSKRIWDQLSNLRQYDKPMLCIVTENIWKLMYYSKSRYIDKSYFSTLATIAYKFNIPVYTFNTEDEFIKFLVYLDKKIHDENKSARPLFIQRKAKSLSEIKENILAQINGVSIKKAQKILECFESLCNVANASKDELLLVEGIGDKLAENIYRTFHD